MNNLPVNWFDFLVVIVLLIGYTRGRKHGMSKELLKVMKWLTVVLVGAIGYEPLGLWLESTVGLGRLTSFVIAYCFIGVFVLLLFILLSENLGNKLAGSDAFGKGEFYLAMPAGMLRFACILVVLLALLNARLYSAAEVKAMQKFQDDNYGSQFFPTLSSVQSGVFEESFLGPQIRKYGEFLLIKQTPPNGPGQQNTASSSRREFTLP
ncbi:MAG TPA: CvpA family protein [Verrucomicrobiae bacterium]|nr:CvpA family protein [Verrucomicrobiae bacterium]